MREWDLEPRERGLRLRVCEWGPPDGRATVILHGYLEQGAAWDAVASRLDGRIVAPDHRGHGLSDHVGQGGFYHFWDYVSDVDALVDAIGAPVDLVGHSMGGTIAGLFAGSCPEKVRRLVLVEGLGPPDAQPVALDRAREFLRHRRAVPAHPVLRDVDEGVERMRRFNPELPVDVARRLVERTTRPVAGGLVWTWDPLHRARSPQPFVGALFERFLRAIAAPTLLVRGGRSPWVLAEHAEREACLADARSLVIAEAGHLVHHDAPDALAAAIRDHLGRDAPTGAPG